MFHRLLPLRSGLALVFLLLFVLPAQAWAAVEVAFYSRELGGNNFPHAFVTLQGTVDATGEAVDTSYGFTAKAVTPAILLGSVARRGAWSRASGRSRAATASSR